MNTFLQYLIEGPIEVKSSFITKIFDNIEDELFDAANIEEIESILNGAFYSKKIEFVAGDNPADIPRFKNAGIEEAFFDFDDDFIYIHYNKRTFLKTFRDSKKWEGFKSLVAELIVHELVHKAQLKRMKVSMPSKKYKEIRTKNKKKTSNVPYFEDKNEIAAYAKEIIHELQEKGYSNEDILKLLKNPSSSKDSEVLSMYYDMLKSDSIPKETFTRLIKKAEEYLR
jgi:DNA-binding transcriptional regulator YhcF (GntR family)